MQLHQYWRLAANVIVPSSILWIFHRFFFSLSHAQFSRLLNDRSDMQTLVSSLILAAQIVTSTNWFDSIRTLCTLSFYSLKKQNINIIFLLSLGYTFLGNFSRVSSPRNENCYKLLTLMSLQRPLLFFVTQIKIF